MNSTYSLIWNNYLFYTYFRALKYSTMFNTHTHILESSLAWNLKHNYFYLIRFVYCMTIHILQCCLWSYHCKPHLSTFLLTYYQLFLTRYTSFLLGNVGSLFTRVYISYYSFGFQNIYVTISTPHLEVSRCIRVALQWLLNNYFDLLRSTIKVTLLNQCFQSMWGFYFE